jgi:hypothetical protein
VGVWKMREGKKGSEEVCWSGVNHDIHSEKKKKWNVRVTKVKYRSSAGESTWKTSCYERIIFLARKEITNTQWDCARGMD